MNVAIVYLIRKENRQSVVLHDLHRRIALVPLELLVCTGYSELPLDLPVNIPEDKQLYISETGNVSLSPKVSEDSEVYQSIPASYLRDAILQEISSNLKKLKDIYEKER